MPAHRETDALAADGLPLLDHELVVTGPDRDDPRLWWIDDRRELIDPEHAEVAHRERRAGELLRLELPLARALGQLLRLARDLAQALSIGVPDGGDDQPLVRGHRHG